MTLVALGQPAFATMTSHMAGAVRDLFASYGSAVDLRTGARPALEEGQMSMAVIGYAGKGVRGALILMTTETAIGAWLTAAGVPDADCEDALGEFANMLLGRLKARLLREGIAIFSTTPTTATGTRLRLSDPPGHHAWSFFEGPGWHLNVRLEATFERDFAPNSARTVSCPPEAGDFIEL